MRRSFLALLVSSCLAVAASAQLPDFARGVSPGKSYHIFDVDAINNYNGNLVLRIPLGTGVPVGPFLTQNLILTYNSKLYDYQFQDFQNDPSDTSTYKRRAVPEDYSNAGLGWTVGLGRLLSPEEGTLTTAATGWRYRAADGAEHELTPSAPSDDPAEAWSRDSSFLRMRRYPATGTVEYREIDFPDGTIHKFNPSGFVTEIRDRAGYWVRIDYSDPMKWVITNGFSTTPAFRTTTVKFVARQSDDPNYAYAPNFAKVVESIDLPAFDGEVATIGFSYDDTTLVYDGCGDFIASNPARFGAPLLETLTLADGSTYSFTYKNDNGLACTSGMVETMTLPTGGTIAWQHGLYEMPQADCQDDYGWVVMSPGVRTRTLKDGTTELGTWTYTPGVDLNPGSMVACGSQDGQNKPFGPPPTQVTNEVLPPEGAKIIHYFDPISGHPGAPEKTWSKNAARRLSTEQFDGEVLERTTYVTYGYPVSVSLGNPTVMGETTVYNFHNSASSCDGEACYVDTDRPAADYDGFGHLRKSVTTSNFGPTRTTFTNYTPDETNWILNTYDFSWVQENGTTARQEVEFDAKGVLQWRRTLADTKPTNDQIVSQAIDLLEITCRNAAGYVTAEKFLFAGAGTTRTDAPCAATPELNEYQIDHVWTMSSGVPATHTARYNGTTTYIADEDLDANTGLVSKSRDAADVLTVFDYDPMGRLILEKPAGRASTIYEYPTANELKVFRKTEDGTTVLKSARFEFDAFGRLVHEYLDMPNGEESRRDTTWNIVGWKLTVSELGDSDVLPGSLPVTTTSFDAFGRPETVRAPDTSQTTFAYTGARTVARTTQIATAPDVPTPSTTTETYDAHGRLIAVREPSGAATLEEPAGAPVTTSYTYDGSNRLRTVTTDTQTREFTYDGRGFLTKEDHPEANATSYTHDARGKVLSKAVENAAAFDLAFEYDSAERLRFVKGKDPVTSAFRVLKEFRFGTENTAGNRVAGKLSHARPSPSRRAAHKARRIRCTKGYAATRRG